MGMLTIYTLNNTPLSTHSTYAEAIHSHALRMAYTPLNTNALLLLVSNILKGKALEFFGRWLIHDRRSSGNKFRSFIYRQLTIQLTRTSKYDCQQTLCLTTTMLSVRRRLQTLRCISWAILSRRYGTHHDRQLVRCANHAPRRNFSSDLDIDASMQHTAWLLEVENCCRLLTWLAARFALAVSNQLVDDA